MQVLLDNISLSKSIVGGHFEPLLRRETAAPVSVELLLLFFLEHDLKMGNEVSLGTCVSMSAAYLHYGVDKEDHDTRGVERHQDAHRTTTLTLSLGSWRLEARPSHGRPHTRHWMTRLVKLGQFTHHNYFRVL